MCANCNTILDILRDGEIIIYSPGDRSYDEGGEYPHVLLNFEHDDAEAALERATKLGEAMLGICGNRYVPEESD